MTQLSCCQNPMRLHMKNVRRGLTHYRHALNYPEARVEVVVKVVIIVVRLLVILLQGKRSIGWRVFPGQGEKSSSNGCGGKQDKI